MVIFVPLPVIWLKVLDSLRRGALLALGSSAQIGFKKNNSICPLLVAAPHAQSYRASVNRARHTPGVKEPVLIGLATRPELKSQC